MQFEKIIHPIIIIIGNHFDLKVINHLVELLRVYLLMVKSTIQCYNNNLYTIFSSIFYDTTVLCILPLYTIHILYFIVVSGWRKTGPSKTGTCIKLESDSLIDTLNANNNHQPAAHIPALILTWRGDEPLDRLHICVKVNYNTIHCTLYYYLLYSTLLYYIIRC